MPNNFLRLSLNSSYALMNLLKYAVSLFILLLGEYNVSAPFLRRDQSNFCLRSFYLNYNKIRGNNFSISNLFFIHENSLLSMLIWITQCIQMFHCIRVYIIIINMVITIYLLLTCLDQNVLN